MDKELLETVKRNVERYPLMRPQDVYKLVYQHEFGCAHAVKDRGAARAWLARELGETPQKDAPLYDDIGNGWARVDLAALDANGVTADELLDWFVKSAEPAGDRTRFKEAVMDIAEEAELPFEREELKSLVREMEKAGFPAVHHSEEYRKAYRPAYRVVKKEFIPQGRLYINNLSKAVDKDTK
ncbi:MAG: hypothetical protein J5854_03430 [Clostridia bacterium]|nr:hypothetical protein [Clostridia bacterium]